MSYATIFAKKVRMCARFGHLPESERSRRVFRSLAIYYCQRCGGTISRRTKREVA